MVLRLFGLENDFITLCDNRNINEFFVCGLVSHGCIRATCLGGIKQGHTIKLLKDGHSNWAKDAKDKIAMVEKELRKEKIEITDRID